MSTPLYGEVIQHALSCVVADHATGKTSRYGPGLVSMLWEKPTGDLHKAIFVARGCCPDSVTYKNALHLLPQTKCIILDDPDMLDEHTLCLLIAIQHRPPPRIILLVHCESVGRELCAFLCPDREPYLHKMPDPELYDDDISIIEMPRFEADAVAYVTDAVRTRFVNKSVIVFCHHTRLHEITDSLDGEFSVIDAESLIKNAGNCRVLVITSRGNDQLYGHHMNAFVVFDLDPGTTATSSRRIFRADDRYYRFYDPAPSDFRLLPSTGVVEKAVCLAGCFPAVDVLGRLNLQAPLEDLVTRNFFCGNVGSIGSRLVSLAGLEPRNAHVVVCCMHRGLVRLGALVAALIQVGARTSEDLLSMVLADHRGPWTEDRNGHLAVYRRIMTVLSALTDVSADRQVEQDGRARVDLRDILADVYSRDLCVPMGGPWFLHVMTNKILHANGGNASPPRAVVALSIHGGGVLLKIVVPEGAAVPTPIVTHLPVGKIMQLKTHVHLERTKLFKEGIFISCRKKGVVRVSSSAKYHDAAVTRVRELFKTLHQRQTHAPLPLDTTIQGLGVVMGAGAIITDVVKPHECASWAMAAYKDMSLFQAYFRTYPRIDPARDFCKVTFATVSDCNTALKAAKYMDGQIKQVTPTPIRSPSLTIEACLKLQWAMGRSTGEFFVAGKTPVQLLLKSLDNVNVQPALNMPVGWFTGLPTTWDEERLARRLGIPETQVRIKRYDEGPQRNARVTMDYARFQRRFEQVLVQPRLNIEKLADHRSLASAVLKHPYAALDIVDYPQEILSTQINGQKPRVWITFNTKVSGVPAEVKELLRRHRKQEEYAVELNLRPATTADASSRVTEAIEALRQQEEWVVPMEIHDPVFCNILCVPTLDRIYISHKRGSPLVRIYGDPAERCEAEQELRRRAALPPNCAVAECAICADDRAMEPLRACGHRFCRACITTLVTTEVRDVAAVCCPHPDCRAPLPADEIVFYCEPSVLGKWKMEALRQFSTRKPDRLRMCPGTCYTFVINEKQDASTHNCGHCKANWCLTCSGAKGEAVLAHRGPCNSDARKAELKELASAGVIACPVCWTPVVREGGCSHLQCPQRTCQAHFCYGCLEAFEPDAWLNTSAVGVVEWIDYEVDRAVVKIVDWRSSRGVEPPTSGRLVLKFSYLHAVKAGAEVETWTRVHIATEIYDHINECGRPVNPITGPDRDLAVTRRL